MLTNRLDLPDAIVRAIKNDKYDPGTGDISVTKLISPPQIAHLLRQHEPIEDASDRIWSLIGQAVHGILERAYENDDSVIVERRFYTSCEGWNVSGQIDVYDPATQTIYDYKITSVWARDGKDEWDQQLNMLRVLLEDSGLPVKHLKIIAIFRDWQKAKVGDFEYPESQVKPIDVDLWPYDTARGFMSGRVQLHQAETPRPCTDEERWAKPEKWAVMKIGRKSAVKLFDKHDAAQTFIDGSKDAGLLDIQHRPKQYTRCGSYCPVAGNCPQLKAEQDSRPF